MMRADYERDMSRETRRTLDTMLYRMANAAPDFGNPNLYTGILRASKRGKYRA
jgi:hypothetical protein